ncbi:MAG: recombinase family protein [Rhodospirillaceae bacterium]|nr:recombinase family protein [Rhodospirillaceae bacterium]
MAVRWITNVVEQPGQLSPKRPVAGYLRSATQLEGDSLRKQLEPVVRYARDHDMHLIRIYCDECGSGLRRGGQSGLQQMFRDIEDGAGDFDAILLLDPSRWGRFQDPDQGACLEYACGAAGIEVHYCAKGLSDDQTPISTIVESVKRAMTREYARELTNPQQPRAGLLESGVAADQDGTAASGPAGQNGVSDEAAGAADPRPASE